MPEDTPRAPAPIDPRAARTLWRRQARAAEPPWLHGEVARRMGDRLQVIRAQPETVLDWGAFLGASDATLAEAYPKARRLLVEVDPLLARRSRDRLRAPWWSARRWTGPEHEVLAPEDIAPGSAQLVWSNMHLHAVADPPQLFSRWHAALATDGFVMFSCFGPDTLRELRLLYAKERWGPASAAFVDMHDLGDMLVHAGFADPVMDQETVTLHWSGAEAALSELRGLGSNLAPGRYAGLRTPEWRRRLLAALQAQSGADGRLSIRFEIAYGHAFKPPPRAKVAAESRVSIDDMRALLKRDKPRGA